MSTRRAMDLRRRRAFAFAALLASAGLSAPSASGPSRLAPVVSPDRMDDAPTNPRAALANFAWRAFIALNWPSLSDAERRGEPDRDKALGDPGKRVPSPSVDFPAKPCP